MIHIVFLVVAGVKHKYFFCATLCEMVFSSSHLNWMAARFVWSRLVEKNRFMDSSQEIECGFYKLYRPQWTNGHRMQIHSKRIFSLLVRRHHDSCNPTESRFPLLVRNRVSIVTFVQIRATVFHYTFALEVAVN